ncbi:hypothetical protein BFP70_03260 [Thioclava sp. SK-1]|nr:hypothetical protein BFP70_03260 [Thioclava sp. SK-1]
MGALPASATLPFTLDRVAQFDTPWAIAPLPDGDLVITTKPGLMYLIHDGVAQQISGVPAVGYSGQNGLLDINAAPDFAQSGHIYFTYISPENALVLERATLEGTALTQRKQIWTQTPGGRGQPGGIIAFGPDGNIYLTVGDRMQPDTAQDIQNLRGKILRLQPSGGPALGNPFTVQADAAPFVWTLGHRNAYGLTFAPDGTLWSHEMGPRGGDELNRIEKGQNYGWPEVSNGRQYSGIGIPDHATRPEFTAPSLYWSPVIAPSGMVWVEGSDIAGLDGTMVIGALAGEGLVQVAGDGSRQIARWDLDMRVRDVAQDSNGALWIIEDAEDGGLYKLVPN